MKLIFLKIRKCFGDLWHSTTSPGFVGLPIYIRMHPYSYFQPREPPDMGAEVGWWAIPLGVPSLGGAGFRTVGVRTRPNSQKPDERDSSPRMPFL